MKTFNVPTRDSVSPQTQILFDQIQAKLGRVPNLLATVGHSHIALKALLGFEGLLNTGIFTPQEREAIALVVSEVNHCGYCLAAHTLRAAEQGSTAQEILSMRKAETDDPKLNALLQLARSITENKGEVSASLVEDFFNEGFQEAALMELVGLISVRIFTNYIYSLTRVPLDYPKAEPLTS